MKIKKILSLVCSVTLIATAVSTGAIMTKADEQQSNAIKVDFSEYSIDKSKNANSDYFTIKGNDGNKYLNFSCTAKQVSGANNVSFLLDSKGAQGNTQLKNDTTYYLTVKYKFNTLDLTDTNYGLCPYIAFNEKFAQQTPDTGSTVTDPVNGLWTKYGYYNSANKTSSTTINSAIGFKDLNTASDGNVWNTTSTDKEGWTTATLDFTTNSTVSGKDMYFGFANGVYGMACSATVDYDIDYIEINEAAADDADAYAKNRNTYLDFSGYYTNNNGGSGVSVVDSTVAPDGATGSKVAKIAKDNAASMHTTFRANLTGSAGRIYWRLAKENTYQLEMRYKLVNTSMDMGVYIAFSKAESNPHNNLDADSKLYFGNETGKGMSLTNPCGDFWDEAAADDNGWVTAKLQFTAPDVCDGSYDTCFGLAFTGSNSKLKMYIDYINIKLTAPVTIDNEVKFNAVPGESMAALAKDAKKENYETDSSKATAAETTYYYDGKYSNKVDLATAKYGANTVLYSNTETVVDTESQAAFCGFDEYKLRTYKDEFIKNEDTAFFNAGYSPKSFSITSNDSYTGTKSLLYNYKNGDAENDPYHKVAYIGNGYELIPGKTYALSFWYKPADGNEADNVDFIFTSGYSWASYSQSNNGKTYKATGLKEQTNEWKKAEFIWECQVVKPDQIPSKYNEISFCAPVLKLQTTNEQTAIYFDSFVISEVATYDGAAKLKTPDNGKQAIRFKYSYDTVANAADDTVKIAGETYTVAERGILVKSANNSANLVRNTTANGVMKAVKKDNFGECWDYDAATGKYEFSMYIKGLDTDDSRELVSRAYVILKDSAGKETVFYSETSTASVEKITAEIESKTTAE